MSALDDPKALAAQLRQPHGMAATAIAERMNRSNRTLNLAAIALLAIRHRERVLEIGPGNAAFAPALLQYPGSRYLGIELSPEMVAEGNQRLKALGLEGRAELQLGDAHALPLAEASHDAALAVNTTYFWPRLEPVLDELARVLRRGGRLCLAFGDAGFMRGLPFAAHGFHLHMLDEVERALRTTGFLPWAWRMHNERGMGNDGQEHDKCSHLLLARRQ